MRGIRIAVLTAVGLLAQGCFVAYMPGSPAPGRMKPVTHTGEWDVALDVDFNRNMACGVDIEDDGDLCADPDSTTNWIGADLVFRHGFTDALGGELRLGTSLMLPLPLPIPSSIGLSPILALGELAPGLQWFTAPRFMRIGGSLVLDDGSGGGSRDELHATGFDVPLIFAWEGARWFTATGTAYLRGYYLSGIHQEKRGDGYDDGVEVSWLSYGLGATVNAIMTFGVFRIAFGGGLEVVPTPFADFADTCAETARGVQVVPQAGLSLGFSWGGDLDNREGWVEGDRPAPATQ